MPRIIMKSPYLKPNSGGGKHIGNYARYIATREGVVMAEDTQKHLPATIRQKELIQQIVKDFSDSKDFHEYSDYRRNPTRENASELISRVMETHGGELANREKYVSYIAERPGVEKLGKHGLFTDEGVPIVLEKVAREMADSKSNIWTHIISLHREDAARLGYDSAEDWMNLLRSKRNVIAQQMRIKPENFRWYAAFHDAGHHPHVHMMAYSTNPKEGYLTERGIETIKAELAKEIFRQDHISIYQKQTQYRDQLREQGRETAAEIVQRINSGSYTNTTVEQLLVKLGDRLSRTSGKKVYGYLKADVKAIVDEIVAELAADERIRKLYDLWYEQQEDVLRTYTDTFPERIPLEQNKAFKPIRNAVIQEAMKLMNGIRQEAENNQEMMEAGMPGGEESSAELLEDPSYWMERFQPRTVRTEPTVPNPEPVDIEAESMLPLRSADSKDWWSDCYKLARKFLYGTNDEKPDYQKAMHLLLLEANCGNGYACYDVGRMYLLGQGCEENEEEAQRWFRVALEAFHTAEQMAENPGYLRYRIGKCHANGHGTEQNYGDSAKWFRQAVDENNPFAAYALGGQYLRGQGVEQSDTEAYKLFRMAATHKNQPNAYAQYQLGRMCREGIGTEINPQDAENWYAKAYQGFLAMERTMADDKLLYRLGTMKLTGTGTEADPELARLYFEKAAELGNSYAEYQLGKIYYFGNGVRTDREKGMEYLKESAAHGNEYAAKLLQAIQHRYTVTVASCTSSLIAQLGRIFQEQDQKRNNRQRPSIDRKHRQVIAEKKQALGIRD